MNYKHRTHGFTFSVLSFCLVLSILTTSVFPAYAYSYSVSKNETDVLLSKSVNGITLELVAYESALIFCYSDSQTRKTLIYDTISGTAEYVYFTIGSETVFRKIVKNHPKLTKESILLCRNYTLDETFTEYSVESLGLNKAVYANQSVSGIERKEILGLLCGTFDNGAYIPPEYSDQNTRVVMHNATPVVLRDSVSYEVTKFLYPAGAGTAIGLIASVLGFSANIIISRCAGVVSVINGVVALVTDVLFTVYTVEGYYIKRANIGGQCYYESWSKPIWKILRSNNENVSEEEKYSITHGMWTEDSIYRNENSIASVAYSNYACGLPVG